MVRNKTVPTVTYVGNRLDFNLSERDHHLIRGAVGDVNGELTTLFIKSYCSLLLDSPYNPAPHIRHIRRFFAELCIGPRDLIVRYFRLADAILHSLDGSSDLTTTGEFLFEMKNTPVFHEYLHFFRTGDHLSLKFLLSFLNFGKKLDYVDDDFNTTAFREWVEIEDDLSSLILPDGDMALLKIIIKQILPDPDDDIFLPRHGPGYVAEGVIDPNDKLDKMSFELRDVYTFRGGSFGRSHRVCVLDPFGPERRGRQIAELRFVPKDIRKSRSMCMETASRMHNQQEVLRWMVASMDRSGLSNIVPLRDQTQNQAYALAGSYSQSSDTIDLKAASDRVHVDLVRALFSRKWLFYLLGTRTSVVRTPQGLVKLQKFAPMGSAVCFPVQCVIFTAITLLAYLRSYYEFNPTAALPKDWYYLHHISQFTKLMHENPGELSSQFLLPKVYGDDIICDYRTTDGVLDLLTRLGFQVNLQKSFIGNTSFRESCGIFAYDGEDVTPTLFRIKAFRKGCLSPSSFCSFVDSINSAGDAGWRHLHSFLINELKQLRVGKYQRKLGKNLPFVTDNDAFGIFTRNKKPPKDFRAAGQSTYTKDMRQPRHANIDNVTHPKWHAHLREKNVPTNVAFHRDEELVWVIYAKFPGEKKISPYIEDYAYNQYMRARVRGGSDEINFSSSRMRPETTRIKLGWTPV